MYYDICLDFTQTCQILHSKYHADLLSLDYMSKLDILIKIGTATTNVLTSQCY